MTDRAPLPLSAWALLRVWLGIGLQSFGGGVATLALIRRASVDQHRWIDAEEFTRFWALCQVAPGINLFGLAILIGWRLRGALGVLLALAGLVLPSGAAAILLTAFFAHIHGLPVVRAALRGVVPATVGVGLWTSCQMAVPLLKASRREGGASLLASGVVLVGSALAFALLRLPVVGVLVGGAAVGALAGWWLAAVREKAEEAA